MPDTQDLNQIEYRHHPTRDLSPAASSMSPQSRNSWHAQIRGWVRHPHDDRLFESACYQVAANGNAAFAWRYLDERAAERADGSRGRPLVSRVLAGPASVLSPSAAIVLTRHGPTADLVGPRPGTVADNAEMPMVSGAAVAGLADQMAPELDNAAMREAGLQAMVAAALSGPATPLAVSLRDSVIARTLDQCVQCVLLWGVLRVAGPVIGSAGRDWSFSTFEPPLGDADTSVLPSIVFREALATPTGAGMSWRQELKVRPYAPDALSSQMPYADRVELAGWLVSEYRDRGGEELAAFLADACGGERSLQGRLELLQEKLGVVIIAPPQESGFVALAGRRAHEPGSRPEPVESPPEREEPLAAVPAGAAGYGPESGVYELYDGPTRDDWPVAAASPPVQEPFAAGEAAHDPEPGADLSPEPASRAAGAVTARPLHNPGDWITDADGGAGEQYGAETSRTGTDFGQVRANYPARPFGPFGLPGDNRDAYGRLPDARAGDAAVPPSSPPAHAEQRQDGGPVSADQRAPIGQFPPTGEQPYPQAVPSPGSPYPQAQPPYPQGQAPYGQPYQQAQSPYPQGQGLYGQPHQPAAAQGAQQSYPQGQRNASMSYLLGQLELVRGNPERFQSLLYEISHLEHVDNPEDRLKSWKLISGEDWFPRVSERHVFQWNELAAIFSYVLLPELRRGGVHEGAIATWARTAPVEMIAGLLTAVQREPDQRPAVHKILQPVLSARWAHENSLNDLWDANWAEADPAEAERKDDKGRRGLGGLLNRNKGR